MRKSVLLALGLSMLPLSDWAQNNKSLEQFKAEKRKEFNQFRNKKQKDFEEFRRKRNEAYAEFLRNRWTLTSPEPVIKRPQEDKVPPVIIRPQEETKPAPRPIPVPYTKVIPVPKPKPQPQPIDPIPSIPVDPVRPTEPVSPIKPIKPVRPVKPVVPKESPVNPKVPVKPAVPTHPVKPVGPVQAFSFYGTEGLVRFDPSYRIQLKSLRENEIADAWLKLSENGYTNLIHDCLHIRQKHHLCDWAYLKMLESMSASIYGGDTNEATLLMAYVYCQSGYRMRLAKADNKLYMLFASDHVIFDWKYYDIDGTNFYIFTNPKDQIEVCKHSYPQEQSMSLQVTEVPLFADSATQPSLHQSHRDKHLAVKMAANRNRLSFYASYPTSMITEDFTTRWAMYANMPMPENVRNQIYPALREAIRPCSQIEAVNKLLNFVQTGFEYKYDNEVWGKDRAFFPEESLFYPYCDCEDRSILLTRLVRDLLGLKCMLVYYPNHLAAAVELTQGNPSGDYIEYQDRRFFIADGTIMGAGAPVGTTMRGMENKTAKIILLE